MNIDEAKSPWVSTQAISWRIDYNDPLMLHIVDSATDKTLISIYIGAILEQSGRTAILEYCLELEKSPWVTSWHDTESREVWRILNK